jgi:hypothetical protein
MGRLQQQLLRGPNSCSQNSGIGSPSPHPLPTSSVLRQLLARVPPVTCSLRVQEELPVAAAGTPAPL